jgi:hypothetical protein
MGTQITIEIEDLEAAGWKCTVDYDTNWEYDEEGNEIECDHRFLVIRKDSWEFCSYCEDCFNADCNAWGRNTPLFKEAGLFDIPHILG